ncbi:hypothetical protein GTO10_00670, partial [Candidatus Saccharibacteria bacterium]|nr:hypothetical protein [Candidatus Saccharibacteria bacterium]
EETANFYINAATGASGLLDALVMWSSSTIAGLQPPCFSKGGKALVKLKKAEAAIKARDVKKAVAAMPEAQKAINEYAKEVMVYGDKFCGGAKEMQE